MCSPLPALHGESSRVEWRAEGFGTTTGEFVLKVVIAGSRDLSDRRVYTAIQEAMIGVDVTEIVSGCARGVDTVGEMWAADCGFAIKRFPADWKAHGRGAGPIRNRQMAEYGDILLAITNGSKGTANMIDQMEKFGKPVRIVNLEAR